MVGGKVNLRWAMLAALIAAWVVAPRVIAQTLNRAPMQIQGIDVEEHIGRQVPPELAFTDQTGSKRYLSEYFRSDKPSIVLMVYYKCPMVCDVLLSKAVETLNAVDFTAGKDYNLLVFSFDTREHTEDAKASNLVHLSSYTRGLPEGAKDAWQFHTGDVVSNKQLAEALGFKYRLLANGEYSHPIAKFVLTPDGRVSRNLYGYQQEPKDMKLALMEASQGKLVRTVGERLMNYCYMFDASTGKYTLQAMRVMQIGALLTLVLLTGLIGGLFAIEATRRRAKRAISQAGAQAAAVIEVVRVGEGSGSQDSGPGRAAQA